MKTASASPHGLREIGREGKPFLAHVVGDELVEARLENRHLRRPSASRSCRRPLSTQSTSCPKSAKTGAGHQPDISRPDHCDMHVVPPEGCLIESLKLKLIAWLPAFLKQPAVSTVQARPNSRQRRRAPGGPERDGKSAQRLSARIPLQTSGTDRFFRPGPATALRTLDLIGRELEQFMSICAAMSPPTAGDWPIGLIAAATAVPEIERQSIGKMPQRHENRPHSGPIADIVETRGEPCRDVAPRRAPRGSHGPGRDQRVRPLAAKAKLRQREGSNLQPGS